MSFKTKYTTDPQKALIKKYTDRVDAIKKALIPTDEDIGAKP